MKTAWGAVLASASAVAVAHGVTAAPPRTIRCDEIILSTSFPYRHGYRRVLGVVSVPRAYIAQVAPSGDDEWPYFSKAGLVVRGSSPTVSVTVPRAWRDRVAIVWGNYGGPTSSLRIAGCPPLRPKAGNAYAGGFYIRARSACVPLVFQVGRLRATVRFGIGRRCPA